MLSAKVEEDQVSSDSPTKGRIPVDGVGNVVIRRIGGLMPGRKYKLTLLFWGQ